MPGILPVHMTAIGSARSARELQPYLQAALELKLIVIPPYLTALFSLCDGKNEEIREILRSAIVAEMQHVALIANIQNAIGFSPILSAQNLARGYPARLPLCARNDELGLKKFSPDLFSDAVLALDDTADPARRPPNPAAGDRPHARLGEFYRAIIGKFGELGDSAIIGDPTLQFVDAVSYSERELFRVYDARSAIRALQLISGEGDVTGEMPINADGSARPDRLLQLVRARGTHAIPFDAASIVNIVENSRTYMYASGSSVRAAVDAFNVAYKSILTALNETFNGRPERYEFAVSRMYRLTSLARPIVATDRGDGTFAAPSFEWSE
ncbi:ferritin-like protein [Bradyrhizobium ontarionense]|uniref:Ferritin-like protein n=1 Tax=Bradyrhizobium ontarionense TaxID=2898149 RepID=A0ABY3RI89_9BRAD|nr:ferritin-like protein [Bradyrhizobium sp. A19]UFZ06359.1 ferritin-like protein [Bradyrhizobium sp. A19]